ncbi:cytosine permease [Nocardioides sp. LHD-245]|uniref:purine-cytosine permease family protein n=1 Tax=Nocardioides sp. LHD-245 TaxID=3051387 RepID=UPI0027DF5003|nr:cytosine permease [Nocardioides sp. LHD-245]
MTDSRPTSAPGSGAAGPLLEARSVDYVPPHERYGSAKSLFTLWFGGTAMGVTLLTGSLAALTDLSLLWSVVAIIVGTLIGVVFVAYHSAQGPVLGLPQMIQSRAQFGFFGANLPLVVVIAMYLGFFGGGAILAGQAVGELFGMSAKAGIFISGLISIVLVVFGYDVLHRVAKVLTPVFIVAFAVLTVALVANWPGAGDRVVAENGFSATGFFFVLGIVAAYFITYGPYVADYSRYLPESTSHAETFWYTYAGMALAGIWFMSLGAAIQIGYSRLPIVEALAAAGDSAGGVLRFVVLLALLVGLINIGALNIYGAAMSGMTIATSFLSQVRPTKGLRMTFMLATGAVGTIGASLLSGDLIVSYENFIFFLIAFLVPWSAINLADFYVVARGEYDVKALFDPQGRYGLFNGPGVLAYVIGCAALAPFVSTVYWSGPIAKELGFDISWLVGLVVPAALYIVICRVWWSRPTVDELIAPRVDAFDQA